MGAASVVMPPWQSESVQQHVALHSLLLTHLCASQVSAVQATPSLQSAAVLQPMQPRFASQMGLAAEHTPLSG